MTGVGLVVYVATLLLSWFGVVADTTEVTDFANSLVNVLGFVLMVVGQMRRKDLKWGFLRK